MAVLYLRYTEVFPTVIAFAITVLLHLTLWLVLPSVFTQRLITLHPVEIKFDPVVVPENRLPPSMRLAEVNVQANRTVPDKSDYIAAKNQTAAQPIPEKIKTTSSLPRSAGESTNAIKVSQGRPRAIEESDLSDESQSAGTPTVGLNGNLPKKNVAETKKSNRNESIPDRPRATIPSGTMGILLKNNVGVNRAGAIAVDAKFSNYGDYSQRMMEAIQSSWWALIDRARFESVSRGSVVVRFNLRRDGSVVDAEILRSDVPSVMAFACKDAVMAPAPFDHWREDMVALFGNEQTVTITFHYL